METINDKRKTKVGMPRLSVAVAILLIGWAAGFALSREAPTGSVEGRLYFADLKKGVGGVRLRFIPTAEEDSSGGGLPTRYARTRENGRFSLKSIAAGTYRISA